MCVYVYIYVIYTLITLSYHPQFLWPLSSPQVSSYFCVFCSYFVTHWDTLGIVCINWSVGSLPVLCHWRNGSLLPSSRPLPAALQGGAWHHDMLMGFILWESCVDDHTCYVFMCTVAMLWPEVSVSQHSSPFCSSYIQAISSSLMSLCFGESEINVPLWAVSLSILTYYVSLHSLLQAGVSDHDCEQY